MHAFSKYLFICIFVLSPIANAAVRVDDEGRPLKSYFRSSSGMEMRKNRRVGIGLSAAGALGSFGVQMELNFTDRNGILLGFGGGSPSFQAFQVEYKQVLSGEWLLPYFTAGYAHWQNFGSPGVIKESTPGFLVEKFMSASDRSKGRIQENIIYPGFGLQLVKLGGSFAGSSIYAEVQALIDISDFVAAVVPSLGYMYYF